MRRNCNIIRVFVDIFQWANTKYGNIAFGLTKPAIKLSFGVESISRK